MLFGGISLGRLLLEVLKYQLGIFDAGNDFDWTTAVFTDLNVDVQDSLLQWHNACHI